MKDKERLLSFDSKLKFIFSHSALKEGWDNPNVFQICTLNETKSEMKKRQEIGRGLRLAVNQDGERIHGFNVNTLTVMANESYEDFARALQEEFEEEENIKFGKLEKHTFANITIEKDGELKYLEQKASEDIWNYFKEKGYVDEKGKVTDDLKRALKDNKVDFPEDYKEAQSQIAATLRKVAGNLNIKNADDKKKISINKRRFLSPEFKELWDKVKYKTTYSVNFDSAKLIKECSEEIMKNLKVDKAKMIYAKADIEINAGGTNTEENTRSVMVIDNANFSLPDIITYLQNETNLTRRTIVEILKQSKRLEDFKNNPQKFMDEVSSIIQRKMKYLIVDGVKYEKLGEDEFYAQELFQDEELYGYLSKNMMESDKSVYEYVVYDSGVEEEFARRFENNNSIKVYAKLPDWFKIETPLGSYNPDWAVLLENSNEEKLYFVLETKGNILAEELRLREVSKIACGHKHFEAIGNEVEFLEIDNFNNFIENL
jgi:type III restriction enzyme